MYHCGISRTQERVGGVIWCQPGRLINEISTHGIPPKISPSSWSQGYEHSWDQGVTQTGGCLEGRHTEHFCRSGSLTHKFWEVWWFTLRDQRQHGRVMSRDSDPDGQLVRGRTEIPQRSIREGSIFLFHHIKNLKELCAYPASPILQDGFSTPLLISHQCLSDYITQVLESNLLISNH